MKKFLFLILAIVLCGTFAACDKNDDATSQTIESLIGDWSLVQYDEAGKTVVLEDEQRIVEVSFETLGKGFYREKARDDYGQWYDQTMSLDWNFTGSRLTIRRLDGERKSGIVSSITDTEFRLDFGEGNVEYYTRM